VEVLKQLEDRTKVAKENIFRQKKELNRLNTDLEEDTRRVEAIKLQNIKSNDLKEHLKGI
jgi:small-conductance mechanosensitive channel